VATGGTYLEPELAGGIVERAIGDRSTAPVLSAREEDVLRGLAWGRSNKTIAAELGLSVKTVESYKASATSKLRLRTRTEIIRYALTRGWLAED
jgi:DNA-binding NarL/FixJ family response regulator